MNVDVIRERMRFCTNGFCLISGNFRMKIRQLKFSGHASNRRYEGFEEDLEIFCNILIVSVGR